MTSDPAAPAPVDPGRVTFLMVGCQRCGTTWTDAALREHPLVHLPPQKQTYYFDQHRDRGDDWYLAQFAGATPEHRAVGEIATGYCLPHAVPAMAALLPHVRLLMTMRHPVERAWSNYRVRCAEQGWSSFEDALERSPELLERGRYAEQVEALLERYPRERLKLLLYEDLSRDDRGYLRAILEFIGLPGDFESGQFGRRRNASGYARLRKTLHRVGMKPVLRALSRSPVGDAVRKARKRRGDGGDGPATETRARLLAEFRPWNDRLEAILDRDLSEWNR